MTNSIRSRLKRITCLMTVSETWPGRVKIFITAHITAPSSSGTDKNSGVAQPCDCEMEKKNCSPAHFRLSFPRGFVEWVDRRWDNVDIQKIGDGCSEESEKTMRYYSFFVVTWIVFEANRLRNWVNKTVSVM